MDRAEGCLKGWPAICDRPKSREKHEAESALYVIRARVWHDSHTANAFCLQPCRVTEGRSGLASDPHPDPDPDRDNRKRYDDHQHVDREPRGYALRRSLGHGGSLRDPYCAGMALVAMNEFTWPGD